MAQVWVARQKGKHGFEKLFAFKCIHARFADDPNYEGESTRNPVAREADVLIVGAGFGGLLA